MAQSRWTPSSDGTPHEPNWAAPREPSKQVDRPPIRARGVGARFPSSVRACRTGPVGPFVRAFTKSLQDRPDHRPEERPSPGEKQTARTPRRAAVSAPAALGMTARGGGLELSLSPSLPIPAYHELAAQSGFPATGRPTFGGLRTERSQRMCDRLVTTELLCHARAVAIERTLDRLWANREEVHGHDGVVGIDLEVPGEDSAKPAPGMGTDDHH